MKTNKELMEWVDKHSWTINTAEIEILFKGMKLVPDDSIVMSREHADILVKKAVGLLWGKHQCAITALKEALQEAEGSEKDD